MIPLLADPVYDTAWRGAAIALQKLVKREDYTLLIPYLDEKYGLNRAYAANVLGYTRETSAIPHLRELLNDPTERVRKAAENAINRIIGVIDVQA